MIDLHLHSTASDGTEAPARVVERAKRGRLSAMALTDHDTLAGLPEALAAGERLGIEVIPGVEISLDHDEGTFHMIGLFIDPENEALGEALERLRGGREDRNRRIVERLCELGLTVTFPEVAAAAGGDVIGRPHFAQVMVERRYVATEKEAFDKWLGKGRPAYVERYRLPVEEAIRRIHEAGGVSILCHPFTLNLEEKGEEAIREFVAHLAELGLDAIEVRYPEHDERRETLYRRIARSVGLLESGGSDYHGRTRRDVRLGVGKGRLNVPQEVLEKLRERAAQYRSGKRKAES